MALPPIQATTWHCQHLASTMTLATSLLAQLCKMMTFVLSQVFSYCLSQIILSAAVGGP